VHSGLRIAVCGAAGFAGALCASLVQRHPQLELTLLTARSDAGKRHDELYPRYRVPLQMGEFDADAVSEAAEAALVAYPHGASAPAVKALRERGLKVVDLSADFRLDQGRYESYYQPHGAPELLEEAVYGLTELHRDAIRDAQLVAAPGCYPTAAILALAPLRDVMRDAIVDAKSGVSGAGRKAELGLMFSEAADNFKAYNVGGHRHHSEIVQGLNGISPAPVTLVFTPHLTPMIRGIHATLYARLTKTDVDLQQVYETRYATEPFVDVMPPGSHPDTRSVRASNVCRIAVHRPREGDIAVILAVIDNLVKGAAGQAVQNMNLMFGLPEETGLSAPPVLP